MSQQNTVIGIRLLDREWKIRRKRWLWNLMPFAGRNKFTSTWGETTYLTPKNWRIWKEGPLPPRWLDDLLRHEYMHVKQWRNNRRSFNVRYLFSRKWRRHCEVAAYAEQCRLSPMERRQERARKYAKWLCSWRYAWTGGRGERAVSRTTIDILISGRSFGAWRPSMNHTEQRIAIQRAWKEASYWVNKRQGSRFYEDPWVTDPRLSPTRASWEAVIYWGSKHPALYPFSKVMRIGPKEVLGKSQGEMQEIIGRKLEAALESGARRAASKWLVVHLVRQAFEQNRWRDKLFWLLRGAATVARSGR